MTGLNVSTTHAPLCTMPSTGSFPPGNLLSIVIQYVGRDNTAKNSLPISWLKVVLFLIFNDVPFKSDTFSNSVSGCILQYCDHTMNWSVV